MRRGAGEVWAVEVAEAGGSNGSERSKEGRGHVTGNSIKLAEARAGARNRAAM